MNPEEYGEKYSDHLFEQYRLYVEMADRVSQRRDQSNRLYVTLLAAIAAILVVVVRTAPSSNGEVLPSLPVVFLASSAIGSVLSVVWCINVWSYRILNSAKFRVINELEKKMPFDGYSREWQIVKSRNRFERNLQLTKVEQVASIAVLCVFIALGIYSAFWLFM